LSGGGSDPAPGSLFGGVRRVDDGDRCVVRIARRWRPATSNRRVSRVEILHHERKRQDDLKMNERRSLAHALLVSRVTASSTTRSNGKVMKNAQGFTLIELM